MKKTALIILCVFVLSTFFVNAENIIWSDKFRVEPEQSTVTVPVYINDATDLYAFHFDITYDQNVLNFDSVSQGNFLSESGAVNVLDDDDLGLMDSSTSGEVKNIILTRSGVETGVTGKGLLINFIFNRVSSQLTEIDFTKIELSDSNANEITDYEVYNIEIWDDTDLTTKYVDENVKFFAVLEDDEGVAITPGCQLTVDGNTDTMNEQGDGTYDYTTSFSSSGNFDWKVECDNAYTSEDTVTITATVVGCTDEDSDNYGVGDTSSCIYPETDCNDNNVNINPGESEVCNGIDDNCVSGADEGDADCSGSTPYCVSGTCIECLDNTDCDDVLFCNGAEICSGGACQPGVSPMNDGVSCTYDDCDEDTDTVTNEPVNNDCQDGLWCNGAEYCDAELDCQSGTAVICDDEISCTLDSCDEGINQEDNTGSCQVDTSSCSCTDHADCDDNNPCTDDTCVNLQCQNTANDANSCDDGFFCTENDYCSQGECVGDAKDVNDGVSCTYDNCDEETDQIIHLPNDGFCDDELFCNGVEVCDIQQNCLPGTPPQIDDSIYCTIDDCDEVEDRVIHSAEDSRCLDGLWCNGAEYCDAELDCQSGTAVICDDEISCTVDSCDEGINQEDNTGSCQVDTSPCSCIVNADCDDNNPCTDDACVSSQCQNTANDANTCDDGFWCTENDYCSQGQCTGDSKDVNDNIECTVDSCDETNDEIKHTPDNSDCDDDLYCNGVEFCSVDLGCQSGQAPNIDDGISCTIDSCDETDDVIRHDSSDCGSSGSGGSSSRRSSGGGSPIIVCAEDWQCDDWSSCTNDLQTRTCSDKHSCGTIFNKPDLQRECSSTDPCRDGIKNNDEEGVDCGGSCEACRGTPIALIYAQTQEMFDVKTDAEILEKSKVVVSFDNSDGKRKSGMFFKFELKDLTGMVIAEEFLGPVTIDENQNYEQELSMPLYLLNEDQEYLLSAEITEKGKKIGSYETSLTLGEAPMSAFIFRSGGIIFGFVVILIIILVLISKYMKKVVEE